LRVLHEQLMAASLATGSLEPTVRGHNYFDEYTRLVLAIARAGDARPFIPVEFWPHVPPPYAYTVEAQTSLQAITNLARERVKLFTERKLLLNRHYALLVAHLLVSPDEIHHARDIPPPYPWPFVVRLDPEDTPYLDVQPDIPEEQREGPAKRVAAALGGPFKQARALERGTTPAAVERRAQKRQAEVEVGKVGYELYPHHTLEGIVIHPRFMRAVAKIAETTTTGKRPAVTKPSTVLRYINLYIAAEGLPPLPRGRPRKH
jgi:hypothetical protein